MGLYQNIKKNPWARQFLCMKMADHILEIWRLADSVSY